MRLLGSLFSASLLVGLLGFSPSAPGQPPPAAQELESATRLLNPGDTLEIHIATLPELEKKYVIRADGTFFHPMAGEVPAAGKTLPQLEKLLRQKLKKELRNPSFRVGLTQLAEAEASVLGEVRAQGKFKFPGGSSVLDLLAQAGGISEKADPDSAVLWRQGKEIPVSLSPARQAEMSRLMVRSGDILYVNKGKRVGVSGEVQTKGVYAVSVRSTNPLEDAVKAAGGPTEAAALNRIQVIRPSLGTPMIVDLMDPAQMAKVVLEDGDVVVVPPRRAVVLGSVSKSGALPLNGGETLMDVLSVAGPSGAELGAVVVVRSSDVMAGNDRKEIYNLEESFSQGKAAVNVPVRDGDVVYVPAKNTSGSLLESGGLLNLLILARSFFAF